MDFFTPSVSVHPGCMAYTPTPLFPSSSARRSVMATCRRLSSAYATLPSYLCMFLLFRSLLSRCCVYMPPLVTVMMRDPGQRASAGASSAVSTYVPSVLVAVFMSKPSTLFSRSLISTPALFTRQYTASPAAATPSANATTDARLLMSHTLRNTSLLPLCDLTCATAASPRSGLRHTMYTLAPCLASSMEVARPMPWFAPVTRQSLPSSVRFMMLLSNPLAARA
mmetsp:Transcript_13835/g.40101  ORF Transcript_13835/g.40101 Transcript_13835/m.40101 type:complete len:224 (-) Transcript_13835:146-817(-)